MKHRLVCVSNRPQLPTKTASVGGLAVGVLGALRRVGGLWFGWSGDFDDEESPNTEIRSFDRVNYATMALSRREFERYFHGFANDVLWPLFHFMPTMMRFRAEDWDAYRAVNRAFADGLTPLLESKDLVWVHDYHLIPLARCLRERGVSQPLGLFMHVPFPFFDMLRVLPRHRELLADMLQFDVAGFQTAGDMHSFRDCIARVYGAEALIGPFEVQAAGRVLTTGVFPIGVDTDALQRDARRAEGSEPILKMMNSLHGRKLMIGVDRLDYSKGLVDRIAAYEQFLESFPDMRGRITYLQIASLLRENMPSYIEIRRALEEAAGRTNGRFGMTDWTPIRYTTDNVPRATLMGFLRAADVGIVTPLRDGMNLVAKEYVAAQDPEQPGVLILSTLCGSARELDAALQVNPHDKAAVGTALQSALTMSLAERRERHEALMRTLRRNDLTAWVNRFLETLRSAGVKTTSQRTAAAR